MCQGSEQTCAPLSSYTCLQMHNTQTNIRSYAHTYGQGQRNMALYAAMHKNQTSSSSKVKKTLQRIVLM